MDSYARNKTLEISKNALSEIVGVLCAEQNVGNLKMDCREFWDSCAQNKTSEISNKCPFKNSGTPARRTQRRISQTNDLSGIMGLWLAEQNVRILKQMHLQELWDSWIMDPATRIRDPGSWIQDVLYPGSWNSLADSADGDLGGQGSLLL